jgi:hypothetical protein
MAKVVYSALITRLRGSLSGSTFSNWKGIEVIKDRIFRPRQLFNVAQQSIRNIMSYLAGNWFAFDANVKVMWNTYASLLSGHMSGLNAYIKTNSRLIFYGSPLAAIATPPPTPDTPDMLQALVYSASGTVSTFVWTKPDAAGIYIILDRTFMVGLDDGSHPRWSYLKKVVSTAKTITDTHGLASGTRIRYRLRGIDLFGRVAPWSQTFTVVAGTVIPPP